MGMTVAELLVAVKGDNSSAKASLQDTESAVQGTARNVGSSVSGISVAVGAVGIAADAVLAKSAEAAVGYQTLLSNIQNNTTMTAADTQQMSQVIQTESAASGASLEGLGLGYMHVKNLGFDAAASQQILDAAMKSAVSTGGDVEKTTNVLAASMKEFGVEGKDAAGAMDVLHLAAARGNMTLDALVESAGPAISTAANLGDKLTDVSSVMSVLSQHGFDAARAGTQVTGMLTHIVEPAAGARKELASLSQATGVDLVGDFSQAGLQAKGLTGIMEDLAKATGGDSAEILKLIPALRGGQGALALTGVGLKDLQPSLDAMTTAFASGTISADAYAQKQKTVGQEIKVAEANVKLAAIALGDVMMPVIDRVVQGLGAGAIAVDKFATAHPQLTAAMLGTVAVAGTYVAVMSAQNVLMPLLSLATGGYERQLTSMALQLTASAGGHTANAAAATVDAAATQAAVGTLIEFDAASGAAVLSMGAGAAAAEADAAAMLELAASEGAAAEGSMPIVQMLSGLASGAMEAGAGILALATGPLAIFVGLAAVAAIVVKTGIDTFREAGDAAEAEALGVKHANDEVAQITKTHQLASDQIAAVKSQIEQTRGALAAANNSYNQAGSTLKSYIADNSQLVIEQGKVIGTAKPNAEAVRQLSDAQHGAQLQSKEYTAELQRLQVQLDLLEKAAGIQFGKDLAAQHKEDTDAAHAHREALRGDTEAEDDSSRAMAQSKGALLGQLDAKVADSKATLDLAQAHRALNIVGDDSAAKAGTYETALQNEGKAVQALGVEYQTTADKLNAPVDPVITRAMDDAAAASDRAREAFDRANDAKNAFFSAPTSGQLADKIAIDELNAELAVNTDRSKDAALTTDQRAQASARAAEITKTDLPNLQAHNKVLDEGVQLYRDVKTAQDAGAISAEEAASKEAVLDKLYADRPALLAEIKQRQSDYTVATQASNQANAESVQKNDEAEASLHRFTTGLKEPTDAATGLAHGFRDSATEVASATNDMGGHFTDTGTKASTLGTAVGKALDAIKTGGADTEKAMGGHAEAINTSLQTISTKAGEVHTEVSSQLSTLGADSVGPASSNGSAVGVALDAGIIGGIMSQATEVANAAAAVVTGAIAAARAAGAIASPSQRAHDEIGVELVAGMIGGIESKRDEAVASAVSVVNAVLQGVKDSQGIASESTVWNKQVGSEQASGQASGYATTLKAKKPVFVDAMLDLMGSIDFYGLGTKAGNDAAQGLIDTIKAGASAIKGEQGLSKDAHMISTGDRESPILSPEELAQAQSDMQMFEGLFQQAAEKARAAWAVVGQDVIAVEQAVGLEAQHAAEEQLKVDEQLAQAADSTAHDYAETWKQAHTDVVNSGKAELEEAKKAAAEQKRIAADSLTAWRDSLAATQELYKDDKIQRHLLGKDEEADYHDVTQGMLTSDLSFREGQRSNALTALATTRDLDQQMADASAAMQAAIGTSAEAAARDNFDRIKGQDDAWRAYTQDLSGRFDDASKIAQDDMKALEQQAKDSAAAATSAESDRHTARMQAIDDEKTAGERQLADEERGIKNESDVQKEWFRKRKEILDDYEKAAKRAEDERHKQEDAATKKQETDAINALTKALKANTDYSNGVIGNTNRVSAAVYGLGQAFDGSAGGGPGGAPPGSGPLGAGVTGSVAAATKSVTGVADEFHTATAHFDRTVDEFHTSLLHLDGQVRGDGGATLPQAAQALENASNNRGGLGTAVSEFRTATGPDGLNGAVHIIRDAGQEFATIPGQLRVGSDGLIHADASLETAANGHNQVNEHLHSGATAIAQGGTDTSAAANGPLTQGGLDVSAAAKSMQSALAALGPMPGGGGPAGGAAGGGGGGGDGSGEHGEGGSPPKGGDLRDALIKAGDLNGTNAAIFASTASAFYAKTAADNAKAYQDVLTANNAFTGGSGGFGSGVGFGNDSGFGSGQGVLSYTPPPAPTAEAQQQQLKLTQDSIDLQKETLQQLKENPGSLSIFFDRQQMAYQHLLGYAQMQRLNVQAI